ncbi:glutaredoxin-C9-like [Arachis hypogaea]|uniref:glutaredoxin-C9-like n=1 Tax=Arachis hypogaea TaxID=3818 RepID=UPI003B21CC47
MQVEASASASVKAFEMVQQLASSNAVVVFSCSDCCMSTVVKRLLFSLGVGPTIVELDEHASGQAMEAALYQLSGTLQPVLAVFVGGKFLGGVQTLMASHINGSLIPLLKEAGALWL